MLAGTPCDRRRFTGSKLFDSLFPRTFNSKKIMEAKWPRYTSGLKKPDNGLLPLLHQIITFLADKGHPHVRLWVHKSRRREDEASIVVDLLRLHCFRTYEEFRKAVLAVLEHHFDNHNLCSDWCKSAMGYRFEISPFTKL
jgi:hypothetical protein